MADDAPQSDQPDLIVQLTDRLESSVGAVRNKVTIPVIKVAQLVVYSVVAGSSEGCCCSSSCSRSCGCSTPICRFDPQGRRVWVADAIATAIFLFSGLFLWRRRGPTPM